MTIAKRTKEVTFKKIKKSETTESNTTKKTLNIAKKNNNTADIMKKVLQDCEDEFITNVSIINNITE
jgi:hypothetical protein